MVTGRIQRRIEHLLDEAEEAVEKGDWEMVRVCSQKTLVLDPENPDAIAFLEATERALKTANDEMEKLIAERTGELHQTNELLQQAIADQRRTEDSLIRLERLRAVGEMSAGVSHNLNNILTSIIIPTELLLETVDQPSQVELLRLILASSIQAKELVERLHQAVRGGDEGELGPVDPVKVIKDAIATTRPRWKDEPESKGISVEVVTRLSEVPPIMGSESGLSAIVINLLFNSVDALPRGGTITISARPDNDGVLLMVQDTGVGMNEETRRRVFEPFFSTKVDVGTGLGLATVHGQVTRWGGSIDVASAPGEGTTFAIWLPAARVSQEPAAAAETHQTRRGNVLIVEDQDTIRNLLATLLAKNYEVDAISSGTAALAKMAPGKYDVALIDLGMAVTPGDQVASEMKRLDPHVATVLITGWLLEGDDPRLAAFDLRVKKPFTLDEAEEVVARALELHDSRSQESA